MDAINAPRLTEPPTVERLRREGVRLYYVGGRSVSVWMLPDRSSWILSRSTAGGFSHWIVRPRDIWED